MEIKQKRALITGGTKGIGAAIALDLARQGAVVAFNGRNEDEAAANVKRQIEALDRPAFFIQGDLGNPEDTKRIVDESVSVMGGLDIIVHSAGGPAPGRIEDVTTEQWNHAFDVHVHGAFHLCKNGLPHLKKNAEAAIIFISSVAGIRGIPGALAYGTVKGAILHFTRMLARDLADDNIRVNCVNPGIIRTRFHEKMSDEAKAHNLAKRIPLHREGTSEQVAEAVRMLISNDFITGESVTIDGGMSMQVGR